MLPVELVTQTGHHILYADLPPFDCLPEVLIWGQRLFRLEEPVNLKRIRYRETFFAVVFDDHIVKPHRPDTEPPSTDRSSHLHTVEDGPEEVTRYPHCDSFVLHAPGACKYCDLYPEAQQKRADDGVNFTGETDAAKLPCPSTVRRPLEIIEQWPSNRAEPALASD